MSKRKSPEEYVFGMFGIVAISALVAVIFGAVLLHHQGSRVFGFQIDIWGPFIAGGIFLALALGAFKFFGYLEKEIK